MQPKLKGTTGLPFEVTEVYPETYKGEPVIPFAQYFADEEGTIYIDTMLDFISDKPAPEKEVAEGWVARDKNCDLNVWMRKPIRNKYLGRWQRGGVPILLPKDTFPSITWESEPQRVKIEITLIYE